MLSKMTEIK